MKLDHLAQPEKRANLVYQVSPVIQDNREKKETKAHLAGPVHLVTKEIEYII